MFRHALVIAAAFIFVIGAIGVMSSLVMAALQMAAR